MEIINFDMYNSNSDMQDEMSEILDMPNQDQVVFNPHSVCPGGGGCMPFAPNLSQRPRP